MEKSLIEKFIEENDLILELEINKTRTISCLYHKSDLYLTCFEAPTMRESINKAVKFYKEKVDGHSIE